MKHTLSTACAYTMLGALVVFGVSGISLEHNHLPVFGAIEPYARIALTASLICAFVAASLASVLSANHAERARAAGKWGIAMLALAYCTGCIWIEVVIAETGARYLGLEFNAFQLTLALVFFALAPRLVSYILAALEGIEREEGAKKEDVDHKRHLESRAAIRAESEARIQSGTDNLRHIRKVAPLVGAAAILAGMSGQEADARAFSYHIETAASTAAPGIEDRANFKRDVWAKHKGKYERACEIIADSADKGVMISNKRLGRILGISKDTAKAWKERWQAEQAHAA